MKSESSFHMQEPLDALSRALAMHAATMAAADLALVAAVSAVRAAGGSWTHVASSLGTSRQAAWERFARLTT